MESILKRHIGTFELTLRSNKSFISELEYRFVRRRSELAAKAENVSSTTFCLRFAEYGVTGLH